MEDTWKERTLCVMEKFRYCVSNGCHEGAWGGYTGIVAVLHWGIPGLCYTMGAKCRT